MGGQNHQAEIEKDEKATAENTAETATTETATETKTEETAPATETAEENKAETENGNGEGE